MHGGGNLPVSCIPIAELRRKPPRERALFQQGSSIFGDFMEKIVQ